jgi:hypothetical protein
LSSATLSSSARYPHNIYIYNIYTYTYAYMTWYIYDDMYNAYICIIYIYIYIYIYMRVYLHMSARFLSLSRLWSRWLSMAPQVPRCRYLKVYILVRVVGVVCVGRRAAGWRRHPWPQWSRNQWEALDWWDCQQEEDAGVRYRGQQGRQLAHLVQRSLVFLCDTVCLPYDVCVCVCVCVCVVTKVIVQAHMCRKARGGWWC